MPTRRRTPTASELVHWCAVAAPAAVTGTFRWDPHRPAPVHRGAQSRSWNGAGWSFALSWHGKVPDHVIDPRRRLGAGSVGGMTQAPPTVARFDAADVTHVDFGEWSWAVGSRPRLDPATALAVVEQLVEGNPFR